MISNKHMNLSLGKIVCSLPYVVQVNLDMTDSTGPGNLVRHMQNLSYIYDEYLLCIGLVPSISSVICKNLSYSGLSYPSSPVLIFYRISIVSESMCVEQIRWAQKQPTTQ